VTKKETLSQINFRAWHRITCNPMPRFPDVLWEEIYHQFHPERDILVDAMHRLGLSRLDLFGSRGNALLQPVYPSIRRAFDGEDQP
jgi:hypothetical protein